MLRGKIIIICYIMICTLLFCACGQQATQEPEKELGEEYVSGSDYQTFFGTMPQVQKVGDGYYLLVSERLFYYDGSMEQAVPVCGRADCNHLGENCNAKMSGANEINYYDHKFYYIASENDEKEKWFLYSLSEDGEQREKVLQIATLDPQDQGISFQLCVHRGYAYFSVRKISSLERRKAIVQRISLRGKATCSEIMYMEGYGAAIEDLSAYGNTLVVVGSYANSADSDFRWHTNFVDIQSGGVKQDVLFEPGRDLIFIYKNREYVYYYDSHKLYRRNIDTNDTKEVKTDSDVYVACNSDGAHLYSCNWDQCRETKDYRDYRIDAYDMDGNKAGNIPLTEGMDWQYGDETSCFAYAFDNKTGSCSVRLFDKGQLPGEGGEWKNILVTGGDADGSGEDLSE